MKPMVREKGVKESHFNRLLRGSIKILYSTLVGEAI